MEAHKIRKMVDTDAISNWMFEVWFHVFQYSVSSLIHYPYTLATVSSGYLT